MTDHDDIRIEPGLGGDEPPPPSSAERFAARLPRVRATPLVAGALVVAAAWGLWTHPPFRTVPNGDIGVRMSRLSGDAVVEHPGTTFVFPGLHDLRVYDLHEQTFQPTDSASAGGSAPFQSVEGLSLGADVVAHYALDPSRIATIARDLPADVSGEVVAPAVRGVIYRVFTRYTVKEIFSTKRAEIQQVIEGELRPQLAAKGIVLRGVQIGKVDLPADYKRGMEALLAEELASEKMQYTLELKDKEVKQAALEAEADKASRIKTAEGTAEARRIEASGEADSRNKLADAEVYRMDKVGKSTSEQMAREGALITRHPLLIQKTMADKLSDKIQVIIAPPPADGGFIGSALLGNRNAAATPAPAKTANADGSNDDGSQENAQ